MQFKRLSSRLREGDKREQKQMSLLRWNVCRHIRSCCCDNTNPIQFWMVLMELKSIIAENIDHNSNQDNAIINRGDYTHLYSWFLAERVYFVMRLKFICKCYKTKIPREENNNNSYQLNWWIKICLKTSFRIRRQTHKLRTRAMNYNVWNESIGIVN